MDNTFKQVVACGVGQGSLPVKVFAVLIVRNVHYVQAHRKTLAYSAEMVADVCLCLDKEILVVAIASVDIRLDSFYGFCRLTTCLVSIPQGYVTYCVVFFLF